MFGFKASFLVQTLEASTGEASGCGVGGKDWAWSRLVVSGVGLVDAGWRAGVQGVFCKDLGEGWSGNSTILGVFFLLLRLLLHPCCWLSSFVLHGASWEGLEGVFGVLGWDSCLQGSGSTGSWCLANHQVIFLAEASSFFLLGTAILLGFFLELHGE